ncbi:hypothetical protein ACFXKD_16735 [Nocardiopsis aegyptia]|uniref:hypothetical protein n=1 Tax=Nocardiopsis aegyptia TaxID=220378 RepID=UPI00366EF5BE
MTEHEIPVGSGPSVRVSLSLPEGTAEAVRAITGKREFSAYIAEAVEHRLRSDLLAQDLTEYQEEHGAFTEQERAWARAELSDEQGGTGHPGEAA